MLDLRPEDTLHKSYLNRVLIEIIDQPVLAQHLAFKGGTCAAMLGYLDRFSVDLDFDEIDTPDEKELRPLFHQVFAQQGMVVTKEINQYLFFQVRYPADPGKRNSLKVSASNLTVRSNQYKVKYFPEIDRLINSQTIETMFANKLVAVLDRYQAHRTIAGRDIYDIHYFFIHGYSYHGPVIQERTGLTPRDYLEKLTDFIKEHVTQTTINEDLNSLLPNQKFQRVRKVLIPETISLLTQEQQKLALSG